MKLFSYLTCQSLIFCNLIIAFTTRLSIFIIFNIIVSYIWIQFLYGYHQFLYGYHQFLFGYHQRETPVPVCSPKLSPVRRGWYLDGWPSRWNALCWLLLGKSGWRSGHQSRLPPILLQMLYVDWVSVDLNLTSRVFSGYSGLLPPQNWLPV